MKRLTLRALAALAAAALATAPAMAQDKIKIGYAISKTGPNAGGATITQIPNYEMWVKEVNAKGGLHDRRQARADRGRSNTTTAPTPRRPCAPSSAW